MFGKQFASGCAADWVLQCRIGATIARQESSGLKSTRTNSQRNQNRATKKKKPATKQIVKTSHAAPQRERQDMKKFPT